MLEAYLRNQGQAKAETSSIENVCNWVEGNKPVVLEEQRFLSDWDDLRCPQCPADKGGLDNMLEWLGCRLTDWRLATVCPSSSGS